MPDAVPQGRRSRNRPAAPHSPSAPSATGAGTYEGTVTDYTRNGREFTGKGKLQGDTLLVSGCVLGGLICRSQDLKRI